MKLAFEDIVTIFRLAQEAPVDRLGNAPPLIAAMQRVADYLNAEQVKTTKPAGPAKKTA